MAEKRISLRKARGGPKIPPPPRDVKAEVLAKVKSGIAASVARAQNFMNGTLPSQTFDPAFDPHAIAAAAATPADTMERILQERREVSMRQRAIESRTIHPPPPPMRPPGPSQSSLVNVPARALREQERMNMRDPDRAQPGNRPAEVNIEQDIRSMEYLLVMHLNPNFMNMQRIPRELLLDIRGAWDSDAQRASLANDIADRMTRELTDSVRQQVFELLRDRVGPGRR